MEVLIQYGLMAGFGLLFIVTPALALATLLWAGLAEGDKELFKHVFVFAGYVVWFFLLFVLIMVIPGPDHSSWWLWVLEIGLLAGSIPHVAFLCRTPKASNHRRHWISFLGLLATLSATTGIGLICYSARFY